MIIDGLGVLAFAGFIVLGLYVPMYDVALAGVAMTFCFGLLWWLNYGDRL